MSQEASPLQSPDIERLWMEAARSLGFRVVRVGEAYASTDGAGTIFIGTPDTLDLDDTLAQLVFHEICHALVQGEENWRRPDWGLDNTTNHDDVREKACLRLQAQLADEHGLRALMIPTTEWRHYYAALGSDPMNVAAADEGDAAEACALARAALALARRPDVAGALGPALAGSAALVARGGRWAPGAEHPLGFALGPADQTCGSCAWLYVGGRGKPVARCRQTGSDATDGRRVEREHPACARWEAPVDCLTCGACCREAYHTVSVSMRDPVVTKQPAFIVRDGYRFSLLRAGDRCACLGVAADPTSESGRRFGCTIYDDRPQTCRDFARGGRHCLTARRRVGLSA